MSGHGATLDPESTGGGADSLHDARIARVHALLRHAGARTVLDLGCGAGRLLARLRQDPQFSRVTGVDASAEALAVARDQLQALAGERLVLVHHDYLRGPGPLQGHDAVVMVETIEHLDPQRLAAAERTVFAQLRPRTVVLTTPNREYNPLYGLPPGRLRDPDHRFEWDRARFRAWAAGVARRNGYAVSTNGIGQAHPQLGTPTQCAHFSRRDD
jgi:3' terminal RNA ribose 2'-O-methyltransferase Hen1